MFAVRAAAAAVFALTSNGAEPPDRLVAGYSYVPPLHFRDAQGNPQGFVVEVVNEAARRAGLQIVWKKIGGSNDIERSLSEGRIDVFPAGVVTEERRARFAVSESWWTEDVSVVTRRGTHISAGQHSGGRRLGLTTPSYGSLARRIFPGAEIHLPDAYDRAGGPQTSVSMVCAGHHDAALMAHSEVDEVLLDRPDACNGIKLQVVETSESVHLAVLSRREKAEAGRRLRRAIDAITLDGTLGAIAGRHPYISVRSAVALGETVRTRYQRRALWAALGGALAVVFVTTILLLRQLRTDRTLRRTLAKQARTEEALRSRTDELSASNEELQAFAYSVSHDLQEPLRVIRLYTQFFERRCPPGSQEGRLCLATIHDAAARMQEMIDNLLVLSRAGRSDVPQAPVSMDELLATVLKDLDAVIRATSAQIRIDGLPVVPGWPDRLSVLLQNLIGNALKYRREGVVPEIEISAAPDGDDWVFSVSDNGIGFRQEYADRIFGAFKRLHGRDEYGGTGLGLSIAKRVVERHGGRIWAEGRPNEGSTFWFTLPARPAEAAGESRLTEMQHAVD
jgi:signal transduction histidine kinase